MVKKEFCFIEDHMPDGYAVVAGVTDMHFKAVIDEETVEEYKKAENEYLLALNKLGTEIEEFKKAQKNKKWEKEDGDKLKKVF